MHGRYHMQIILEMRSAPEKDIVIKEIRNIVGSGHNKHRHIKWIITWEWLFLIAKKNRKL